MEKSIQKIIVLPFLAVIKIYRWVISPWLPFACRYQPTCSEYSREAFERFGVIKGLYLTMHRVIRCHPWGGSGYNPVPLKTDDSNKDSKKSSEQNSTLILNNDLHNKSCCDLESQRHQ